MSARLLLPHDADRDDWLAARRRGVTASEIATILGISPWDSAFNLYWKKRGTIGEDYDNDAMSLGRHLEPWIADRWAADHPEYAVSVAALFANTDRPWQLATPDRLVFDDVCRCGASGDVLCSCLPETGPVALLEIKSSGTYDGWGEDGTDEIPPYYRAQVLWQLDTLGLAEAHVTCWFKHTDKRRDYLVAYDMADVDLMRKAAQEFLAQLATGTPPPIDGHKATTAALKALHPTLDEDAEASISHELAQDYRDACKALTEAKAIKALHENEIRAMAGDAKRIISDADGSPVATRSIYQQSGTDTKRLRAEHPDAYAACRTATTVDKLTPARAKKEAS